MSRSSFPGALLVTAAVAAIGGQARQTPPPFRSEIDVVRLDVSVLDRAGAPVRDLTAGDFTVYEDGVPRPLVAFDAVEIPSRPEPTAAWMRDADRDVVTNEAASRRVVVIVLDDAFLPIGDAAVTAQRVARDVVDRLGEDDWAAVTFTGFGHRQDITQDRRRLREAIDSLAPSLRIGCEYRGKVRSSAACVIDTLVTAARALARAPNGRKTIVFVSAGPVFFVRSLGLDELAGLGLGAGSEALALQDTLDALQRANVTLYAIDPSGLNSRGLGILRQSASLGPEPRDGLRLLAEATGGRTTVATNTPWTAVPQIFRENSSYYLLGVRPANANANGKFRRIRIVVDRPDVEVRARAGYYPRSSKGRAEDSVPPASPLDAGLASPIPGGDFPLGMTLAPFAVPGWREAAVAIAVQLREPLVGGRAVTIEVATLALDADCGECRQLPSNRQRVSFTPPDDGGRSIRAEVLSRLALPPGRYEIRAAATLEARSGGVFAHLEVPDYRKDRLSASGLALSVPEAFTAQRNALADIIPVVPAALREFDAGMSVTAFLRIYQGEGAPPAPVRVTATILDDRGRIAFTKTIRLEARDFGRTRSADYGLAIPTADLLPGAHLLRIEAELDRTEIRREARFWMK